LDKRRTIAALRKTLKAQKEDTGCLGSVSSGGEKMRRKRVAFEIA